MITKSLIDKIETEINVRLCLIPSLEEASGEGRGVERGQITLRR